MSKGTWEDIESDFGKELGIRNVEVTVNEDQTGNNVPGN